MFLLYKYKPVCSINNITYWLIKYHISYNIIHLLHAGEGNMKMYSYKSITFPEGNVRGEYDARGWIHFHVSLYWMKPRKHIHVYVKYCW